MPEPEEQGRSKGFWSFFREGEDRGALVGLLLGGIVLLLVHLLLIRSTMEDLANDLVRSLSGDLPPTVDRVAIHTHVFRSLSREATREFWSELVLHLSVAFLVAFLVIVLVERYSRREFRKEAQRQRDRIAQDVWSALFARLIPPEVVAELDDIVKLQVVKDRCRYTLTFLTYDGLPEDRLVLRRTLTYTARNTTNEEISLPIVSSILNPYDPYKARDETGVEVTLPRHIDLRVDGRKIDVGPITQEDRAMKSLRLCHAVDVEAGKSVTVMLSGEEMMPRNGANYYTLTNPTVGLTVVIQNRVKGVQVDQVQLSHPHWQRFLSGGDDVYEYKGGILPGQGFSLRWASRGHGDTVPAESN